MSELIWGADHMYEDYGLDGEGIVSNFCCPNEKCNAFVLVHLPFGEENETEPE
tara:strand:+ start:422 stop:580 length:159 start_codon:yes stop_codon:yes gene_type:complete